MNNEFGRQTGIVLRSYGPRHTKVALLDKKLGRIDALVSTPQTSAGVLISYEIQRSTNHYFAHAVQLEQIPLAIARLDLLFLHHLLEVCFYFIPVHSGVAGIFELLEQLYCVDATHFDDDTKKLFLFKLLMNIGLYPELPQLDKAILSALHRVSIDTHHQTSLNLESKKVLELWLRACIAEHHNIKNFNTVHFLTKNRLV